LERTRGVVSLGQGGSTIMDKVASVGLALPRAGQLCR
jgi:hypothetical protein